MGFQIESTTLNEPLTGEALFDSVREVWVRWHEDQDDSAMDELVHAYSYLVESGVQRVYSRLPSHVNREELHAAALGALFLALRRCDPALGASFESYARKRIYGAIMDLLRHLDGVPRNSRRATRRLTSATNDFRSRNGRGPCQEELAEELELDSDELSHLESQARTANVLSLDATPSSRDDGEARNTLLLSLGFYKNPLDKLVDAETREALVKGLQHLPERHRAVMVLHYSEGIRFNEIAAAMGVSEARVSQIHSLSLERLRDFLTQIPTKRQALRRTVEASCAR